MTITARSIPVITEEILKVQKQIVQEAREYVKGGPNDALVRAINALEKLEAEFDQAVAFKRSRSQ